MTGVTATIETKPYQTDVTAGEHTLTVDEPESIGGGNSGPNPFELLAASLASCTAITLRMYADRKGWAMSRALVRADIHQSASAGPADSISLTIELSGDLSDDQRARLLEIAQACPVHKTLISGVKIESSPKDSSAEKET